MTLNASAEQQRSGFEFQNEVLLRLRWQPNSDWREHRPIKCLEMFGCDEAKLTASQHNELNYAEQKFADLVCLRTLLTIECQRGVDGVDCCWEASKFKRSEAELQAFGFRSGTILLVRTDILRFHLKDATPLKSKRTGGGDYYQVSEKFLIDYCGGKPLL